MSQAHSLPDHVTQPFGAYRLTAWESFIIGLTRAMPQGWGGKRLALLLRKLVPAAMGRPVDMDVFGLKMRLNGAKNVAERRLLIHPQHFDPEERQVLAGYLKPGQTAVDIGANVGAYTLFMGALVAPGGRVLAVEPQPSVLDRLRENLSFNPGLTVTIAPVALGDRDGEAQFQLSAANEGEGKLTHGGPSSITVKVETLHNLIVRHGLTRVDVLKIDVEGGEPDILLPFFKTAPRAIWPRMIVLERIDNRWSMDLVGQLKETGYAETAATRLNVILTLP